MHNRQISPSEETGNRYPDQNLNLEFEIESHILNKSPASPPDSNDCPSDNSTPSGGHVIDSGGDKKNDDVTEGMNTNEFREFEIAAGHHQTGEAGDNQTVKTPAEHNSTGTNDIIQSYHVIQKILQINFIDSVTLQPHHIYVKVPNPSVPSTNQKPDQNGLMRKVSHRLQLKKEKLQAAEEAKSETDGEPKNEEKTASIPKTEEMASDDEEDEEVPAEINLIPIEENASTSTRTRRQQKEQLAPPSGRDKIECPFCKMTCMRRGIVQHVNHSHPEQYKKFRRSSGTISIRELLIESDVRTSSRGVKF